MLYLQSLGGFAGVTKLKPVQNVSKPGEVSLTVSTIFPCMFQKTTECSFGTMKWHCRKCARALDQASSRDGCPEGKRAMFQFWRLSFDKVQK